ncbi:unnamed protein product [Pedinophyceae sp. YPF-701]|nr:unnamed protein product [Pedinophyceae sp. YPF-701]
MAGSDAAVQLTNDDAQVSKLSCVKKGYFKDDFVHFFVRRAQRRPPLINRGYYARYSCIRDLREQFFDACKGRKCQVLCLGAGFDTAYLQSKAEGGVPETCEWFEVEFHAVCSRKCMAFEKHPELKRAVGDDGQVAVDVDAGKITAPHYRLVPGDLRRLEQVSQALLAAGFDPALPTLVVLECVLVYLEPEEGDAVARWAGSFLAGEACCVVYEQVNPHDSFGKQMLLNLEARGCPLRGIFGTPTLAAHEERFLRGGWTKARATDMRAAYVGCTDPADRLRAERLEIFDELEEWSLIQEHYCITVAYKEPAGAGADAATALSAVGLKRRLPQAPPFGGGLPGRPGGLPCAD